MELRGYMRVVADRWILIVSLALVGLAGGVAYTVLTPKTFRAEAKLFVAPAINLSAEAKSPTLVYSASQFVLQRIPSYTQLAGSGQVLQPVINSLGLKDTVPQLASTVSVENPTQSVILDVSVTDKQPQRAARVANAVADELAKTIESLERANSSAPSPVVVTVTEQAAVPSKPASPRGSLDMALGLVIGLAMGLALAVLLARFDDTIKTARDVREIAGAAPLALTHERRARRLRPSTSPSAQTTSSLESLRVGLALTNGDVIPNILAITSPVSHDGKAAIACGLAVTIARTGRSVCLVEADLREPTVDRSLGLSHARAGLNDLLAGKREIGDVLHDWDDGLLTVVAAGEVSTDRTVTLSSASMGQFFGDLAGRFDVVVVDASPVLPVTDALAIARVADATVVVVRYGKTKKESLAECFNVLRLATDGRPSTVLVGMSRRAWRKYSRHVADLHQRLRDQYVSRPPEVDGHAADTHSTAKGSDELAPAGRDATLASDTEVRANHVAEVNTTSSVRTPPMATARVSQHSGVRAANIARRAANIAR